MLAENSVEPVADRFTQYHYLSGGAIYKLTGTTPKSPKGDFTGCGQKSPLGDLGVKSEEMLYTYTDHLGSITHITDASGNLKLEQSFDAWGRYRDPETWEYEPLTQLGSLTPKNTKIHVFSIFLYPNSLIHRYSFFNPTWLSLSKK